MTLHANAVQVLTALPAGDRRDDFLAFLAAHPDALSRECAAGHLTASTLVVDPVNERALLMLHRKVGKWLQMGGHCESDDLTLREAAEREAREESGVQGLTLSDAPVNLDRHGLTSDGRALDHLDVQYLAVIPMGARIEGNDESLGLQWFDFDCVPVDDTAVQRLVAAARRTLLI